MSRLPFRMPARAVADARRGRWTWLLAAGLVGACASQPPTPLPPAETAQETSPGPRTSGASETASDASSRANAEAGATSSSVGGDADSAAETGGEESTRAGGAQDGSASHAPVEPGGAAESPTAPPEALTDSERISRLDERLRRGFGEFDGLILREQQAVQTRTQEHGAELPEHDDAGRDHPESADSMAGDRAADGDPTAQGDPSSGAGNQPDMPASRSDGQPSQTAANIPPDIPDGGDDDVVARQIREAAIREKDPALRAKLWDEYRKYKNRDR